MPKSLKHIEAGYPLVVLADMMVLRMTLRDSHDPEHMLSTLFWGHTMHTITAKVVHAAHAC